MRAVRYSSVAILIHWSVAALIVFSFLIGLTVDNFPKSWTSAVINTHALAGLSVLALTIFRLAWRLSHKPPEYPRDITPAVKRLSHLVQTILYILMIVVPVIGIPTLLYRGRGLDFGLFGISSPFERSPDIFHPLTDVHELAAFALLGLAAGHMLAALYHQTVRKDAIMGRMALKL
jgi:cytochrome b561